MSDQAVLGVTFPVDLPTDGEALKPDPVYTRTVIIPTIGNPDVLIPAFRTLRETIPDGTRVIVVFNPTNPVRAAEARLEVERLGVPSGCRLDCVTFPGPIGFGGANNAGLAYAAATGGVGELIVTFNDDLRATPGWLESLEAGIASDEIQFSGEFPDQVKGRPVRSRAGWGEVGMIGPVTTVAAGNQGAIRGDFAERLVEMGHVAFSRHWRENAGDRYVSTGFLSGFCLAITRRCANAILMPCPVAGFGVFDSEAYPIAGYEDNDICLRASRAGFRLAVDWRNYVGHVGHQSFDSAFPEMQRGMRNRVRYYGKFSAETQRLGQRLVGLYRVRIGSVQDLQLFEASLSRHASILDGVAVLLTNNPGRDMPLYPDWRSRGGLKPAEQSYLQAVAKTFDPTTDPETWKTSDKINDLAKWTEAWIAGTLLHAQNTRFNNGNLANGLRVEVWTGDWNERDERNRAIEMANGLAPDWLLSIDHDECIEDRIRREHFERWMTHPDPMVSQYDFGWLDHWIDTQHYRTDPPWGDGGRYAGGRHGRRLWRANPAVIDRILAGGPTGLHCGNIPDAAGAMGARATGARFRHFGYVRQLDRHQRFQRYQTLDPNPDPILVGGSTYGHIVSAEGMRIEFFSPQDGIAVHMLCHAGEDVGAIAEKLDNLYALADHVVMVWTGAESPDADPAAGGMSEDLRQLVQLFKCDVLHAPLRDAAGVNFAACRNAAIDHISAVSDANRLGIGWGLIVDPDEHYGDPMHAAITLRRMAEATEIHGWIMQFRNPTVGGHVTMSDSVRLHRLTPEMRMRGRVHESFDTALRQISNASGRPALRVSTLVGLNPGLSNPATIDRKIRGYAEGLIAELTENPGNGGAWASLGLQFEAEGRHEEAQAAYRYACATLPESYIGYRAMMAVHLRIALAFAQECQDRLSTAHGWRAELDKTIEFLRMVAQPPANPATKVVLADLTLPPAPQLPGPVAEPAPGE